MKINANKYKFTNPAENVFYNKEVVICFDCVNC